MYVSFQENQDLISKTHKSLTIAYLNPKIKINLDKLRKEYTYFRVQGSKLNPKGFQLVKYNLVDRKNIADKKTDIYIFLTKLIHEYIYLKIPEYIGKVTEIKETFIHEETKQKYIKLKVSTKLGDTNISIREKEFKFYKVKLNYSIPLKMFELDREMLGVDYKLWTELIKNPNSSY